MINISNTDLYFILILLICMSIVIIIMYFWWNYSLMGKSLKFNYDCIRKGDNLVDQKKFDKAIVMYDKAIKNNSGRAFLHKERCLKLKEEFDK